MTSKIIKIAEYTRFPGGRVKSDGPYSGAAFRDEYIRPALENFDEVIVIIDGVMGYGSSFLEECFGGLTRIGFAPNLLKQKLKIQFTDPAFAIYEQEIWEYIGD